MSTQLISSEGESPRDPHSGSDGNARPLGETADDRLVILDLGLKSRLKAGESCRYVKVRRGCP